MQLFFKKKTYSKVHRVPEFRSPMIEICLIVLDVVGDSDTSTFFDTDPSISSSFFILVCMAEREIFGMSELVRMIPVTVTSINKSKLRSEAQDRLVPLFLVRSVPDLIVALLFTDNE